MRAMGRVEIQVPPDSERLQAYLLERLRNRYGNYEFILLQAEVDRSKIRSISLEDPAAWPEIRQALREYEGGWFADQ